MATFLTEESKTFGEFLLDPRLTQRHHTPENVSLKTSLVKFKKGTRSPLSLDIPLSSAAMQSVSDDRLAIALAEQGGISFIYGSQEIKDQAKMVENVKKRDLKVGAAVNTRDYEERIPALVDAGADVLCIDSSDGYSEWQKEVLHYVRDKYGDDVKIGAGNVVSAEAFNYLADNGADLVKVGIGGGSICITREQKAIGLGQATAVKKVVEARTKYLLDNNIYVPICSDGGIVHDRDLIMAMAFGADFAMMGRYFAGFDESPGSIIKRDGKLLKPYWGEGSSRARNWQRYFNGGDSKLIFEEGVDGYVPYAGDTNEYKDGSLAYGVQATMHKLKSTMCSCGATTLKEFTNKAIIAPVSNGCIIENSAHNIEINR